MGKADESMYAVNQTVATTPDSSVLLMSPSTHGDSPLMDTSLNTTVKRKRRHKHSSIQEQIDIHRTRNDSIIVRMKMMTRVFKINL